jgi:hypothetical protein
MADYVKLTEDNGCITVAFYIEDEKVMALGDRLAEICEDAYMNGYNWDALLTFYLRRKAPALLDGMESDPEAGMYAAYYDADDENRPRAEGLAELITELVADGDELCEFVEEYADEIEWD